MILFRVYCITWTKEDTKCTRPPPHLLLHNLHRPVKEKQANLYVLGEHLKQERQKKTTLKYDIHAFKTGPKTMLLLILVHFTTN